MTTTGVMAMGNKLLLPGTVLFLTTAITSFGVVGRGFAAVFGQAVAPAANPMLDIPGLGMFMQGGSFLLVVYVVVWMYPKETAAARKERADKALAEKTERDQRELERKERDALFNSLVVSLQDRFDRRNDRVVDAIRQQTNDLKGTVIFPSTPPLLPKP